MGKIIEFLPIPVLLPGEFHGQKSLTGYSPWSRRELDANERLMHIDTLGACIMDCTELPKFPFRVAGFTLCTTRNERLLILVNI